MMPIRTIRTPTLLAILAVLLATAGGCAHRRQSYDASDLGPSSGVHVRAPFVDVHVKKKPKAQGMERLSHRLQDDDDDEDEEDRD